MCNCGCRDSSAWDWPRRGPRARTCACGCGCEPAGPTTAQRREALERDKQDLEERLKAVNEELGRL